MFTCMFKQDISFVKKGKENIFHFPLYKQRIRYPSFGSKYESRVIEIKEEVEIFMLE